MNQFAITDPDKINNLFPFIKDKMVIDFINGVTVAQRLNQNQHEISENFLKRNLGLISGKTQRSQNNINDHILTGLQACQAYFAEISQHHQIHANLIAQLDKQFKQGFTEVTDYLIDFKQEFKTLQQQVAEINVELSSRIDRLEWSDRANSQLDYLLQAWQAEQYNQFAPMAQCYLVLDNLNRGDYGFFIRQLSKSERSLYLDTLKNKIINVQKSLLDCGANDDMLKSKWLTASINKTDNAELQQVLQYQGDWTWQNPSSFATAFTATQLPMLETVKQKQYDYLVVSMIDIDRISKRMTMDIFG